MYFKVGIDCFFRIRIGICYDWLENLLLCERGHHLGELFYSFPVDAVAGALENVQPAVRD